ncbi:MAG: alpha/beta fold hydrolase [Pseudomonadota bacterium]
MAEGASTGDALTESHRLPAAAALGDLSIDIHWPSSPASGLALVVHGRNGAAAAPHMIPAVDTCLTRNFVVVAPNLSHSAHNDSAGVASGFTMAGHLADLQAVYRWARARAKTEGVPLSQTLLVGHSMGAYAVCRLAAERPQGEITGVVAISPVVSGNALIAARRRLGEAAIAAMRRELPQAETEYPQHDLAPVVADLTMPLAVIVGADDTVTPPQDATAFAATVPRAVHTDVLVGEHHCPLGPGYRRSLGTALDQILSQR